MDSKISIQILNLDEIYRLDNIESENIELAKLYEKSLMEELKIRLFTLSFEIPSAHT